MLKYALSATRTKGEAMRLLGLVPKDFKRLEKKFNTEEYLTEDDSSSLLQRMFDIRS